MTPSKMKTMDLTVIRTIEATPPEVFDVWLDSKSPGSPWFGVARAIVNPVVDGLFYHAVQFEDHDWAHYGRFVALNRPQRIQHTWVPEATRGLESIVTLTFSAQGDQTPLLPKVFWKERVGKTHSWSATPPTPRGFS